MAPRNRAVRARSGLLQPGYSTVREDERIVDDGLRPRPRERVLVITSGGCISLKLLLADVAEVVCVDASPYQTALLQLKAAAARTLSHGALWEFLGLTASSQRRALYERARTALAPDAARYWDERPADIEAGVTLLGRNDRFLHWIGQAVTAIQGRRRVDRLLACTDLEQQRAIVERDWNTRRWRAVLDLALADRVLARVVDADDAALRIRAEIDHVLRDVPIADNFYVHYMLRRTYASREVCPAWLRASNHARIAERVGRLTPRTGYLASYLSSSAVGTFDAFYLSNIFDWMTPVDAERVIERITEAARPGARLCYWTNLLNRSPESHRSLRPDHATAATIFAGRRAPGYSACTVATIGGEVRT